MALETAKTKHYEEKNEINAIKQIHYSHILSLILEIYIRNYRK